MKSKKAVTDKKSQNQKVVGQKAISRTATTVSQGVPITLEDSTGFRSNLDAGVSVQLVDESRNVQRGKKSQVVEPKATKIRYVDTKIKLPCDPAQPKDLAEIAQQRGIKGSTHHVVRYSHKRKNSPTKDYYHKIVRKDSDPQLDLYKKGRPIQEEPAVVPNKPLGKVRPSSSSVPPAQLEDLTSNPKPQPPPKPAKQSKGQISTVTVIEPEVIAPDPKSFANQVEKTSVEPVWKKKSHKARQRPDPKRNLSLETQRSDERPQAMTRAEFLATLKKVDQIMESVDEELRKDVKLVKADRNRDGRSPEPDVLPTASPPRASMIPDVEIQHSNQGSSQIHPLRVKLEPILPEFTPESHKSVRAEEYFVQKRRLGPLFGSSPSISPDPPSQPDRADTHKPRPSVMTEEHPSDSTVVPAIESSVSRHEHVSQQKVFQQLTPTCWTGPQLVGSVPRLPEPVVTETEDERVARICTTVLTRIRRDDVKRIKRNRIHLALFKRRKQTKEQATQTDNLSSDRLFTGVQDPTVHIRSDRGTSARTLDIPQGTTGLLSQDLSHTKDRKHSKVVDEEKSTKAAPEVSQRGIDVPKPDQVHETLRKCFVEALQLIAQDLELDPLAIWTEFVDNVNSYASSVLSQPESEDQKPELMLPINQILKTTVTKLWLRKSEYSKDHQQCSQVVCN